MFLPWQGWASEHAESLEEKAFLTFLYRQNLAMSTPRNEYERFPSPLV